MAKKETKNVVVICKDEKYYGKELNLPNVGIQTLSLNGEVKLDEETAEALVSGGGWKYAVAKELDEEEETEKTDDQIIEEEEKEEEASDDSIDVKALNNTLTKHLAKNMDFSGLKALADGKIEKSVINKWKSKSDAIKSLLENLSTEAKQEIASQI